MYRATTSLPVPLSPPMSTVESVGATCSASLSTSRKRFDFPIGRVMPPRSRRLISCLSCLFSTRTERNSAARRRIASSSSLANGFWM